MATIQFHEIHTLENLVRKLGIGNAFIRFQTGSYDFFSDHGADAIVLSNISQKVESGKVTSPVQVIDHGGTIVTLKRQIVLDRKSTRLNSSHVAISYAVFCLKKK